MLLLYYPKYPYLAMCGTLKDMRFMAYDRSNILIYTQDYLNYPTAIRRINKIFNKNFQEHEYGASQARKFLEIEMEKYRKKYHITND